MNKKIISGICAAAMMLGTVALADGGLTSACAKNASDIAEVKDLAIVLKNNSEKTGTRLYNIDQSISDMQSQIDILRRDTNYYQELYNNAVMYNGNDLSKRMNSLEIGMDALEKRVSNEIASMGYSAIWGEAKNLGNRISGVEDNMAKISYGVDRLYDWRENINKTISDLTDYTESFHADYNNNMDMIYADIDNLYALLTEAQAGATVGEVRDLEVQINALENRVDNIPDNTDTVCQLIIDNQNLYALCNDQQAQIANLQAQIDALSAYVYG